MSDSASVVAHVFVHKNCLHTVHRQYGMERLLTAFVHGAQAPFHDQFTHSTVSRMHTQFWIVVNFEKNGKHSTGVATFQIQRLLSYLKVYLQFKDSFGKL